MNMDLVIIAIPPSADAETREDYIRTYFWVMNWSLGYSQQQWDGIAIPPSVGQPNLNPEQLEKDRLARRLIKAQDLATIDRPPGDDTPVEILFSGWLRNQALRCRR